MDITDIYRTLQTTEAEYTFLSSTHETLSKTNISDHMSLHNDLLFLITVLEFLKVLFFLFPLV